MLTLGTMLNFPSAIAALRIDRARSVSPFDGLGRRSAVLPELIGVPRVGQVYITAQFRN